MKKKEPKNSQALLLHDRSFVEKGFTSLAGVDEAGRGPLAGPVVASAVIVRDFSFLSRVDDSKILSTAQRDAAFEEILEKAQVGVGIVEVPEIDKINILEATLRAMQEALVKLGTQPDAVLIDGNRGPRIPFRQFLIVDGDAKSFSIACASIVAKVTRDRIMEYYDSMYPQYGFAQHKGYGTKEHLAAIRKNGPCRIHRKSFEPVKSLINGNSFNN